jgi:hypothetical protein
MIGTPHSERAARLMAYLAIVSFALSGARADEVFLEGGKLTGTVTGIDASGSLVLQTPLATEPLGIRASAIRKIVISAPADNSPEREDIAELSNGDKLPGDIKSYLNGSFEISTWYAGAIRLPRAAVSAVHFGLRKEHSMLSGPGQLGDWQEHEGWTVEGNELVAKSAGMIRRAVNLPDSFRYRGRVSWAGQEPNQPNLQIFFAESPAADNRKSDCYIITFNYAGLELKRQNSQGKTWNSIRVFNMRPEDFPKSEFDFEIRVNRARGLPVLLELIINGESKGLFEDVSTAPATGSGIAFRSNEGAELHVSGLEITGWDAKGDIFRSEDRGDTAKDSVIYDKGQRAAGELLEIRPAPPDAKVIFKSPLAGRLEMPGDVVSSLFLAKTAAPAAPQPFVISLRGGGSLRAALQPSQGDHITLVHPLIGTLSIPRAAITMIERSPAPAKP